MIELEYFRQLKFTVLSRCAQIFKDFHPDDLKFVDGFWCVGGIRLDKTMAKSLKKLDQLNVTRVYY